MMYAIQQITSDASQTQTLVLPDGTQIAFAMQYAPGQQCWNMNLSYGSSFAIYGVQIANNPNLLQPFQNLIPFGIACFSSAAREPSQIEDFQSGYASLYILTQAEVAEYNSLLSGDGT